MNYEMLKIAIDVCKYLNEINHNCFSEVELHEGAQLLYEAMEKFKANKDMECIQQYFDTVADELETAGDDEDGTLVKFIDWIDSVVA